MVKAPFLDKRLVERDPMLGYLVAKAGHEWRPELEPILVFEEKDYSISITNNFHTIEFQKVIRYQCHYNVLSDWKNYAECNNLPEQLKISAVGKTLDALVDIPGAEILKITHYKDEPNDKTFLFLRKKRFNVDEYMKKIGSML